MFHVDQDFVLTTSRTSRILVVDDDPSLRILLRTIFELAGYEVTEAGHGNRSPSTCRAVPGNGNRQPSLFSGDPRPGYLVVRDAAQHDQLVLPVDMDLVLYDSEPVDLGTAGQGKFMLQGRRNPALRLDVDGDTPPDVLVLLLRELKLGPSDVHVLTETMDLINPMAFQAAITNWPSATA
jgi:hypothetical protein